MIRIIKYFPDQFNIHRRFSLNQKGAREGEYIEYYLDGSIKSRAFYNSNGLLHNYKIEFHRVKEKNIFIKDFTFYKNGIREGKRRIVSNDGKSFLCYYRENQMIGKSIYTDLTRSSTLYMHWLDHKLFGELYDAKQKLYFYFIENYLTLYMDHNQLDNINNKCIVCDEDPCKWKLVCCDKILCLHCLLTYHRYYLKTKNENAKFKCPHCRQAFRSIFGDPESEILSCRSSSLSHKIKKLQESIQFLKRFNLLT